MGLGHDNDQQHCPSHQMFESLIKQALDNLSERMTDGVDALRAQNQATTDAMEKTHRALEQVLINQADRRELCGKQCSRIDALHTSDEYQWAEIRALRRAVHIGIGIAICSQVVVVPMMLLIIKKVWP